MDGSLYYVHSDLPSASLRAGLGSTVAVSNDTGQPMGWMQYDPCGAVLTSTLPVTLTDRLFTGARFDGTIGLYQMGARWYDPYLGRWIQADTIVPEPGNPQDLNRYTYVRNNPLRYTDPSGHYVLLEDETGAYGEFSVRILPGGEIRILSGGRWFRGYYEIAIANYVLSGERTALPETWGALRLTARGSMNAALIGLGYRSPDTTGSGGAEVLMDPLLVVGLSELVGKATEDAVGAAASISGRFVRKSLPPLEGSFREAFEGEPELRTLEPGQQLYRAEAEKAPGPGSWFGTKPTTSLTRAERWWNILKHGPRNVLRVYEVTEPVTVYYGKVAGGRGTQILLPLDVDANEVVRRVDEWTLVK